MRSAFRIAAGCTPAPRGGVSPTRLSFWGVGLVLALAACGSGGEDAGPRTPVSPPAGRVFRVAPDGSDSDGDGSSAAPWATLGHALASVPAAGGVEIRLSSGIYDGPVSLQRGFDEPVLVVAEERFGPRLRNGLDAAPILYLAHQGPVRVEFEGLVLTNDGVAGGDCSAPAGHLLQMTNVGDVVFREVLFLGNDRMPRCNHMVKINLDDALFFPTGIRFENCFFSTPPAVDGRAMLDVFEPGEIDLVGNLFAGGRSRTGGGSFVHLWGQWGREDVRTPRYLIEGNVFIDYRGGAEGAFLEFGGEGASIPEISDALVQNNLFVGGGSAPLRAPILLRGVDGVTIRGNSFVGAFDASASGVALGSDGANPPSRDVDLFGNLWAAPQAAPAWLEFFGAVDTARVRARANLRWAGGGAVASRAPLPPDPDEVVADPLLPDLAAAVARPVFDPASGRFRSGAMSVREEIEGLVTALAEPGAASPARDAAGTVPMPEVDILGRSRDARADMGAREGR